MQDQKCRKLIIVGCGASGMMAGCIAGLDCDDVLILDANNVPGKKILATGNGKCNFTNIFMREDRLNQPAGSPVMDILDCFDFEDVLLFFEKIGVPVRINNDYCYPYSREAVSVRDALYGRLTELGVKVKLNNRITKIENDSDAEIFSLHTDSGYIYKARKVILACGGLAGPSFGCDGSVYGMLGALGAKDITGPLPALVGLTSSDPVIKELSGVRAIAKVSLKIDDNITRQETGEIIFSTGGISGIPVMNMSRYAVRAIDQGRRCSLSFDFFGELSRDKLKTMIMSMVYGRHVSLEKALVGIVNHKLLDVMLLKSDNKGLDTDSDTFDPDALADLLKNFQIAVTGNTGWENAQVTTGGLSLDEVDISSMQTRFCKGLYVTGETLDVDGCCGGYNLQWAWSTGAIAGACATYGKLDKARVLG
ncbi:MAG: aminoacetone oxidase family FAD-binding enzyme [Lachnospiraceae bacterium]|nr:aminoacetone oxidase family FAD-binding enzyme [Lachnospiraceae bacterium]